VFAEEWRALIAALPNGLLHTFLTGAPGDGPLVTFARSGLSVAWPARQHSLPDLADSCDVPTRWSCRTGVCHTCSTGLLSGQTTYVTEPLEPPPDGEVLICCAAPSSDVVIDL
jgi:ferredoxin